MTVQIGDTVIFRGGVDHGRIKFSGSDYPSDLIIGKTYVVEDVDTTSAYTNITLKNKQGKFNFNLFQLA